MHIRSIVLAAAALAIPATAIAQQQYYLTYEQCDAALTKLQSTGDPEVQPLYCAFKAQGWVFDGYMHMHERVRNDNAGRPDHAARKQMPASRGAPR